MIKCLLKKLRYLLNEKGLAGLAKFNNCSVYANTQA